MLFLYIVQKTNKVSIGPLEYCGHGTLVKTTHQQLMSAYFTMHLTLLIFNLFSAHPVFAPRNEIIRNHSRLSAHSSDVAGGNENGDDTDSDAKSAASSQSSFDHDHNYYGENKADQRLEHSMPPASSSGYYSEMEADAENDLEQEWSESLPVDEPPQKKRKLHLTADREMCLQQEPSSSSSSVPTGRQSRVTKKPIYAPEKRTYVKKSKK